MTDQLSSPPSPNPQLPEDGSVEWLFDTMDQPRSGDEERLGRGIPWWFLAPLLLGLLIIAGVLWLLLGRAPAAFRPAVATPMPTATSFVLAAMTPTARPALVLPTATQVLTPTPPAPFEIGDRVMIAGTGTRGARFRAGAGLDYLTIAIVQDDDVFFVLPTDEEGADYPVSRDGYLWWRLRGVDGEVGWTVEEFLVPAPLPTETPSPAP